MECGPADLGGCRHGDEALMSLGRFAPNTRETPEETKEFYWRNYGYVVLPIDDPMLPWDLREQLARYMTRRHGTRRGARVS